MFATSRKLTALAIGLAITAGSSIAPSAADAQTRDKVTMGLFIASSAMPERFPRRTFPIRTKTR